MEKIPDELLQHLPAAKCSRNVKVCIHDALINRAKEYLTASNTLSVAEIAYRLGFEYPQSFNKLFKRQTNMSPLAFRAGFMGR